MSTNACGVSGKPCPTEEAFAPCDGAADSLISIEPTERDEFMIRLSEPAMGLPEGNATPTLDQLSAMLTTASPDPEKSMLEYSNYRAICRSDDRPYRFFVAGQWPPPASWKHPAFDTVRETMHVDLNRRQHAILRNILTAANLDGIIPEEIVKFARSIIDTGDPEDFLFRFFALVSLAGARNLFMTAGPGSAFLGDVFDLEEEIGAAVADGRISFARRERQEAGLIYAEYQPDDNTVHFQPLDEVNLQMLSAQMVHELTHAQQDLKERAVVRIDAEEEAYVREWAVRILRRAQRKALFSGLPWNGTWNDLAPILSDGAGATEAFYNACQQAIVDALRGVGAPAISELFRAYYRPSADEWELGQPPDELWQFDGI